MIFNRIKTFLIVLMMATLVACPGQDENSMESGLRVHFAEAHVEQQLVGGLASATAAIHTPLSISASGGQFTVTALSAPGGYDRDNLEHHDITDNNSHLFSIYRAYLVLDRIDLVRCNNLSQLPGALMDSIIRSASAHAGHGAEPVGGRSLDAPNIIDIVTIDEYVLPLGDLAVAPGEYCGIRVSFAPLLDTTAYGLPDPVSASTDDPITEPEVPNMVGRVFSLRGDFCSSADGMGGCAARVKVDIDDSGLDIPPAQTINFAEPLVVSENLRTAYVTVGITYGAWAADVDVALLQSDSNERQKFFNNIASSLHIYAKGWGDLPPNILVP